MSALIWSIIYIYINIFIYFLKKIHLIVICLFYLAGYVDTAPKADVHSQQRFHCMGHSGEIVVDQAHRCVFYQEEL